MDTNTNWIKNLDAIDNCKEDIKSALINKGVDMTDVTFSGYAGKINALQLESGDTPAPTPSVDYMYCNGNVNSTDESDIISFSPYEIVLNSEGKFIIELYCPEEIPGFEGGTYYDIIFTMDVPTTYNLSQLEVFIEDGMGGGKYEARAPKENPRYPTVVRDGVTYNSYVRSTSDGLNMGSVDVQFLPLRYRITIDKK